MNSVPGHRVLQSPQNHKVAVMRYFRFQTHANLLLLLLLLQVTTTSTTTITFVFQPTSIHFQENKDFRVETQRINFNALISKSIS